MQVEYGDAKRTSSIYFSIDGLIANRVDFDRKSLAVQFENYLKQRNDIKTERLASLVTGRLVDHSGFCSEHFSAEYMFEYLPNNLAIEFSKRQTSGRSFDAHEIWTFIYDTVFDKNNTARWAKSSTCSWTTTQKYQTCLYDAYPS